MVFLDTIFALSSGALPSGVGVVRISGPQTRFALETICGCAVMTPRQAVLRDIRDSAGELLDRGLVLWFPGPASFTGEDCGELQVHGGKAVVAAILHELQSIPGLRYADAGEFTRRAFAHGKLDLVQAEALADLISSETEAQRRLALVAVNGAQSELYDGWRARLLHARAMLEAELDFADEADVPGSVSDHIWADLKVLAAELEGHIDGYRRGEMVRDGFDVVIMGAPNAGKSSLLNHLAKREVAIVSDEPGTTRDLLEVQLDLDGYKVRMTDTAGLRDSTNRVEQIGIERARLRAGSADLVLVLSDVSVRIVPDPSLAEHPNVLWVGTKADLQGDRLGADFDLTISVRSGEGIDELLTEIGRAAAAGAPGADLVPSQLRHHDLLRLALRGLQAAFDDEKPLELRGEELRLCGDLIGRITGAIGVEELLGAIFGRFCIGK